MRVVNSLKLSSRRVSINSACTNAKKRSSQGSQTVRLFRSFAALTAFFSPVTISLSLSLSLGSIRDR
jgi:hypothetical protein